MDHVYELLKIVNIRFTLHFRHCHEFAVNSMLNFLILYAGGFFKYVIFSFITY